MLPTRYYPGSVYVSEFDGTTICASNHKGVAATAPDPLCREHYKGGPVGGHHFAPDESPERQKGNAARIALTWNCHDDLIEALHEVAKTLEENQRYFRDYDIVGILRRARLALLKAGHLL